MPSAKTLWSWSFHEWPEPGAVTDQLIALLSASIAPYPQRPLYLGLSGGLDSVLQVAAAEAQSISAALPEQALTLAAELVIDDSRPPLAAQLLENVTAFRRACWAAKLPANRAYGQHQWNER